jgi:hypothetical protein
MVLRAGAFNMSKVIDLVPHLKTVAKNKMVDMGFQANAQITEQILDFDSEKKKLLFQERRHVKRTILSEFMSAMIVLPEKGLLKVSLYDISEEGISFEVDDQAGQFKVGEQILMRVYLNQKTYFPIQVAIKHTTPDFKSGVNRHGTTFEKGGDSDVALQHFVKFIESASEGLKKDNGDLMVTRTS